MEFVKLCLTFSLINELIERITIEWNCCLSRGNEHAWGSHTTFPIPIKCPYSAWKSEKYATVICLCFSPSMAMWSNYNETSSKFQKNQTQHPTCLLFVLTEQPINHVTISVPPQFKPQTLLTPITLMNSSGSSRITEGRCSEQFGVRSKCKNQRSSIWVCRSHLPAPKTDKRTPSRVSQNTGRACQYALPPSQFGGSDLQGISSNPATGAAAGPPLT